MAPCPPLGHPGKPELLIRGLGGGLMQFIGKSVMAAIEEGEVLRTRLLY